MKNRWGILLIFLLSVAQVSHAQKDKKDKDERKEEQDEKKASNKDRVDYTVFRRQILTLPEFSEQRKNLAEIKKSSKAMPKIYAVVDSMNENEDGKTLMGFIQVGVGDNIINTHEITFDRIAKKIVLVKPTGEKLELEKDEPADKQKTKAKPAVKKKKTDEDDEDDDEEKTTKEKQNDDDD